jgi:hypothetical protein
MRFARSRRPAGARPELTIWIRLHRHERLVRRVVEAVRSHAGEVLVIADAQLPAERLAVVAGAEPDRILRVPSILPAERAVAWIQEQCRGRWVLRLDGDEVPGPALLDALPALIADDRFSHYQVPRTWLWGDARRRLDERPWWPDHQARLTRNDPALTHIPGRMHTCAEGVGPRRFLEAPIHHLVLLLESLAERRQKVAHYERAAPGAQLLGRPFNSAYYLPEELAHAPAVAALERADAESIDAVLQAADAAAGGFRRPRTATAEEVDARWAARPWSAAERAARLEVLVPPAVLPAGSSYTLRIWLEQRARAPWPGGWPDGPRLDATWTDDGGERRPAGAVPTPGPLAPGMSTELELPVRAPGAGRWSLVVRLLDPHGGHVASAPELAIEVTGER